MNNLCAEDVCGEIRELLLDLKSDLNPCIIKENDFIQTEQREI